MVQMLTNATAWRRFDSSSQAFPLKRIELRFEVDKVTGALSEAHAVTRSAEKGRCLIWATEYKASGEIGTLSHGFTEVRLKTELFNAGCSLKYRRVKLNYDTTDLKVIGKEAFWSFGEDRGMSWEVKPAVLSKRLSLLANFPPWVLRVAGPP